MKKKRKRKETKRKEYITGAYKKNKIKKRQQENNQPVTDIIYKVPTYWILVLSLPQDSVPPVVMCCCLGSQRQ